MVSSMSTYRGLPRAQSRGFVSLGLILLLVIALAVLGGAGWYVSQLRVASEQATTETASTTTSQPTVSEQKESVQSGEPKTYSTHPSIKAYLQGPSEVAVNTVWKGLVVIPHEIRTDPVGAPEILWDDWTIDSESTGTYWDWHDQDQVVVTHTYKAPGTYRVQINIGGKAEGFKKGTVLIFKTITVR